MLGAWRARIRDPRLAGAFVALGLSLCLLRIWTWRDENAPRVVAGWWLDLNTHRLFQGPREGDIPVAAPSGPLVSGPAGLGGRAGVRAFVYSCADCSEKDWFVGFVAFIPADRWEDAMSDQSSRADLAQASRWVSVPPDGAWLPLHSPEGKALTAARRSLRCPSPTLCMPTE